MTAFCRSARDQKKIAVVGPLADSTHVLEGNYNGTPSHAATPLTAFANSSPPLR